MTFKTFTKTDLIKTRKADLIELCLERGLNASGLKKDLIATLISFQPVMPVVVDSIPQSGNIDKTPTQALYEVVVNKAYTTDGVQNYRNELGDDHYRMACRAKALFEIQAMFEQWLSDYADDLVNRAWATRMTLDKLSFYRRPEASLAADAASDYEVRLRTLINS